MIFKLGPINILNKKILHGALSLTIFLFKMLQMVSSVTGYLGMHTILFFFAGKNAYDPSRMRAQILPAMGNMSPSKAAERIG